MSHQNLNDWQQHVYSLCWSCGTAKNIEDRKMYGRELDRLKAERPNEYAQAFQVWEDACYEILG